MKKTITMKKNYEFKKVLTKGNYYTGKYIEAFIKKKENNKNNVLGIAIGVKIGKAVKRNHIKRLIRESYIIYEEFIKKGYAIVILWKKKAQIENATFSNIKMDMQTIFEKAKIIEESHENNIN